MQAVTADDPGEMHARIPTTDCRFRGLGFGVSGSRPFRVWGSVFGDVGLGLRI